MFKFYYEFLSVILFLLTLSIETRNLLSVKKTARSDSRSIDPCEDFNRFVCGENGKPSLFEEMKKSMFNIGKRLISKSNENYSLKLRNFYTSCVNTHRIKRNSLNSIRYWYQEFIVQFKKHQKPERTSKEQFQSLLELFKTKPPFHQLFILETSINSFNTTNNIPQISRPNVYLINDLLNEKNQKKIEIKERIINKAIILLAKYLNETINEYDIFKMMRFENAINKIWSESPQSGFEYFFLKKLAKVCPAIDWRIIETIYRNVAQTQKLEFTIIQTTSLKSVINTCLFLEYFMESKDRYQIVENYLKWSTIFSMLRLVSTSQPQHGQQTYFENILTDYSYAKTTKRRETKESLYPTRGNICLELANQYFPLSLTSLYASSMTNIPKQQQNIRQIFQNLTESMKFIFKSSSWLTDSDKIRFVDKINSMRINTFYPKVVTDRKYILKHEKSIIINKNDFFNNVINVVKFNYENNLKSLSDGRSNEHFTGFEINAYYIFQRNQIKVPMGIIQNQIYHLNMSNVEKYSKLGFIIGHEILHGFDPIGIYFDSNGNLNNLLEKKSFQEYKERASCFIHKYNRYNLPGELELKENIADNLALEISYMSVEKTNGYMDKMDNQKFFYDYAKMFCSRPKKDRNTDILKDTHSPDRYRILGPTSNSKIFESAYQCNRKKEIKNKKCHLW